MNRPPISQRVPPISAVPQHRVKLPLTHGKLPLAIRFTYDNYMFPRYSTNASRSLVPTLRPQSCSLCLRLHCCQKENFLRTKL